VYEFIESATSQYQSCIIVSLKNKCATIVVAILYLLIKFKWTVHRTLEYINSKKLDIEITKTILKELGVLEAKVQEQIAAGGGVLRADWRIDPYISNYDPYDSDEDNISCTSRSRLRGGSKKLKPINRIKAAELTSFSTHMGESTFILLEEEASIINHYKNS
jgi:hypothetical protein